MSYSFSIRGSNKEELSKAYEAEWDKIVAQQPIHANDRVAAKEAFVAVMAVAPEATDKDMYAGISGYVSTVNDVVVGCCCTVNIGQAERAAS